MKTKEEILDLTKMWFLHVYSPNYKVVDAYNIPEFTPAHWFILERIRAIIINSTCMYSVSNRNHYEDKVTGLKYYWISSSLLLSHTMRFGIKSKQTISRIIADWRTVKPEILVTSIQGVGRGSKIFYAFTEFANTMLFNTGNVDVSGILGQHPESETEDKPENDNDDPEVPAGTTKDPVYKFPEWFDAQWEVLKASGRFTSCNKCNVKTGVPYKYAIDFAKGVEQLIDGTFYKGVGRVLKDKTIPIPEGLTVDTIIDSIQQIPENKCITNPLTSLVLTTRTMCYSPLLKYWEKNGTTTSSAGSSARSQATSPVTKPVTKELEFYTEEECGVHKQMKYLWDQKVRMWNPTTKEYEWPHVYGALGDSWLEKNKHIKKFDKRVCDFYTKVKLEFDDAKDRLQDFRYFMDAIKDVAEFNAKRGSKNWEELFWEYIRTMQPYQDNWLWEAVCKQFYYANDKPFCKMYNKDNTRQQAMERDAQLRACEATAFGEED